MMSMTFKTRHAVTCGVGLAMVAKTYALDFYVTDAVAINVANLERSGKSLFGMVCVAIFNVRYAIAKVS